MNSGMQAKPPEPPRVEHQTGQFYCSGCGRKFRYTHEGYAVCLTRGCKFGEKP